MSTPLLGGKLFEMFIENNYSLFSRELGRFHHSNVSRTHELIRPVAPRALRLKNRSEAIG